MTFNKLFTVPFLSVLMLSCSSIKTDKQELTAADSTKTVIDSVSYRNGIKHSINEKLNKKTEHEKN